MILARGAQDRPYVARNQGQGGGTASLPAGGIDHMRRSRALVLALYGFLVYLVDSPIISRSHRLRVD